MVLAALLVASAGCSSITGGSEPPKTLTAEDMETHRSTLQNEGTATIIVNATVPVEGETVQLDGITKANFENNRAVAETTIYMFGGVTIEEYYNGNTTYEKIDSDLTGTQYNASEGDQTFMKLALLNSSDEKTNTSNDDISLASDNESVTFERVDTQEGTGGATVYKANRTELIAHYNAERQQPVTNATMEIHRTSDGLLNFVNLRLATEQGGETQLTEFKIRISDVGNTTVEKPDWVETAEMTT
jgi:hypothetical protein